MKTEEELIIRKNHEDDESIMMKQEEERRRTQTNEYEGMIIMKKGKNDEECIRWMKKMAYDGIRKKNKYCEWRIRTMNDEYGRRIQKMDA